VGGVVPLVNEFTPGAHIGQLVKLRRDQEAALVDVRVALANDFRAKEVEWTREKEALQQRIAQLEHQVCHSLPFLVRVHVSLTSVVWVDSTLVP